MASYLQATKTCNRARKAVQNLAIRELLELTGGELLGANECTLGLEPMDRG